MSADHIITITPESAEKALRLVVSLNKPAEFAQLLENNVKTESRETNDGAVKRFLEEPHIMVSGYDTDVLFHREGSRDTMQLYIRSMMSCGVKLGGVISDDSYTELNQTFGVTITPGKVRRLLLPLMILVKLTLKFDIPSELNEERPVMATSQGNVFTGQIFQEQLYLLDHQTLNRDRRTSNGVANSYAISLYFSTLAILSCSAGINEPEGGLQGMFLSQLYLFDMMLLSPSSIRSLNLTMKVFNKKRNEADLSSILEKNIIEFSKTFHRQLLVLLEEYLPCLLQEGQPQNPTDEFRNFLLNLKVICPLIRKLAENETLQHEKTAKAGSTYSNARSITEDEILRSDILQRSYVRPDLQIETRVSLEDSSFPYQSIEIKSNELILNSKVTDFICVSPGFHRGIKGRQLLAK